MNNRTSKTSNGGFRIRMGMILMLVGLLLFLIGATPDLFGLDRSPVIGFVQIAVFLIGLAVICLGGFVCLNVLWNNRPRTILADVGLRLVLTGYVIAVVSGMADILGFGTQLAPQIPFYGRYQAMGVLVGEIIIVMGFILQIPFRQRSDQQESTKDDQQEPGSDQVDMVFD